MSEASVDGVVLRKRDLGESDRSLVLLTAELGKIDVVAKGARKPKSRLGSGSEPLAMGHFLLTSTRKRWYVTQVQAAQTPFMRKIREDYDRLTMALALLEGAAAVLPWEEPNEQAFIVLTRSLAYLAAVDNPLVAFLWAGLRMLDVAGFLPRFASYVGGVDPVRPGQVTFSPVAGGALSPMSNLDYSDGFSTRGEALIGLDRLAQLDQPPEKMKFVAEATEVLFRFWRASAEAQLPAWEGVARQLRETMNTPHD